MFPSRRRTIEVNRDTYSPAKQLLSIFINVSPFFGVRLRARRCLGETGRIYLHKDIRVLAAWGEISGPHCRWGDTCLCACNVACTQKKEKYAGFVCTSFNQSGPSLVRGCALTPPSGIKVIKNVTKQQNAFILSVHNWIWRNLSNITA